MDENKAKELYRNLISSLGIKGSVPRIEEACYMTKDESQRHFQFRLMSLQDDIIDVLNPIERYTKQALDSRQRHIGLPVSSDDSYSNHQKSMTPKDRSDYRSLLSLMKQGMRSQYIEETNTILLSSEATPNDLAGRVMNAVRYNITGELNAGYGVEGELAKMPSISDKRFVPPFCTEFYSFTAPIVAPKVVKGLNLDKPEDYSIKSLISSRDFLFSGHADTKDSAARKCSPYLSIIGVLPESLRDVYEHAEDGEDLLSGYRTILDVIRKVDTFETSLRGYPQTQSAVAKAAVSAYAGKIEQDWQGIIKASTNDVINTYLLPIIDKIHKYVY